MASGASNRQTKALATSVRDFVREAGFPKPRVEGEDNGEWIIVDCGPAVAHIMQPAIRQYYHLEEIWGDKPVRLKFGAPKTAQPRHPESIAARKTAASKAPARSAAKATAKHASPAAKSRTDAKKTTAKAPAKRAPARKAGGARKTAVKSPHRKG